jgi:hypothetical protein
MSNNGNKSIPDTQSTSLLPWTLPHREEVTSTVDIPPLPDEARVDESLAATASPWLDAYIAFSRKWSPRAYDGFHEACGVWLLSVVAARRVMLHLGGEQYTPLLIALTARTSLHAKSTTARIATETLKVAGLHWLLAADASTPQKFIQDLTLRVPNGYTDMSPDQQEWHRQRLGFAGQRGWFYEEFGQLLHSLGRKTGPMADFRSLIRRFDDCQDRYEYATLSRGNEVVERPYLALLGNMTPADLRPQARRGSSMWSDGFWARFAFVTPPDDERKRERFPRGKRVIPSKITVPLQHWHERLGVPSVQVETLRRGSDLIQQAHIKPAGLTSTPCTLGDGVEDAYYHYDSALLDMVQQHENYDLDGNYVRFSNKALRVAMLLASLENDGHIELCHWARGQTIAEHWRANLHYLYEQLNGAVPPQGVSVEEKVLKAVKRLGEATARQVALNVYDSGKHRKLYVEEAREILDKLVKQGVLKARKTKRTTYYSDPNWQKA